MEIIYRHQSELYHSFSLHFKCMGFLVDLLLPGKLDEQLLQLRQSELALVTCTYVNARRLKWSIP